SGAIFGLFGALATFAFRRQTDIPDFIRKSIFRRVFPLIALNLVLSFSVKGIDKAAHLGGFVAGIALAFLIPHQRVEEKQTPHVWRAMMIACFAVVFISFVIVFKNYDGPSLQLSNLVSPPNSKSDDYSHRMVEADKNLIESFKLFADVLNRRDEKADLARALREVELGMNSISDLRGFDKKSEEFRQRLMAIMIEQKNLLEKFGDAKSKNWDELETRFSDLDEKHSALVSDYNSATER
ncbi:MAG: rhomboid family intramembrane serine protease, partial [Acidobacteriota bacterium]